MLEISNINHRGKNMYQIFLKLFRDEPLKLS